MILVEIGNVRAAHVAPIANGDVHGAPDLLCLQVYVGAPGIRVVAEWTRRVDSLVVDLFRVLVEETEYTPYWDALRLLGREHAIVPSNPENRFRHNVNLQA